MEASSSVLLNTRQAAEMLNISPQTLMYLRVQGNGPLYVRLGRRMIRYRDEDLLAWIAASARKSTSDPGPGLRP